MIKLILTFLIAMIIGGTAMYTLSPSKESVGTATRTFRSTQLAVTPQNGYVLYTDGAENYWDSAAAGTSLHTDATTYIYPTGGKYHSAPYYVATSTLTASTIPYASSTAITATNFWGTASLATALGANGANCASGNAPLGVDASGAVESCFDVWTEAENTAAGYLSTVDISADTNLAVTSPIVLTDDTISINQSLLSITESQISDLTHYTNGDVSSYLYASTTLSDLFTAGTGVTWTGNTLNVDDSYLLNNGDVGTGVYDFGGATSFEIVNGASPTVDAIGEIAIDTTADQFKYYGASAVKVLGDGNFYPAFTYATTTAWTGTTTLALGTAYVAETWNGVQCYTDAGTVSIRFGDGTNWTNSNSISTTVGTDSLSSNNTFTAQEKRYVEVGTPASSPTTISCTVSKSLTAN